jgi:hypothetical protein
MELFHFAPKVKIVHVIFAQALNEPRRLNSCFTGGKELPAVLLRRDRENALSRRKNESVQTGKTFKAAITELFSRLFSAGISARITVPPRMQRMSTKAKHGEAES